MNVSFGVLIFFGAFFGIVPAQGQVVTTITDLAWVGTRLAQGTPLKVEALLDGSENPHFVTLSRAQTLRATQARVLASVGLGLESSWLPRIDKKARCDLSASITPLEATGADLHARGDPHYWLGYRELAMAATRFAKCIQDAWPHHQAAVLENLKTLQGEIINEERQAEATLKPALGDNPNFFEFHREYSYFLKSFGYQSRATLESKPGVEPDSLRIREVAAAAKREKSLFLLSAPYYSKAIQTEFSKESGVPVLEAPGQWIPSQFPSPLAQRRDLVARMIRTRQAPQKD